MIQLGGLIRWDVKSKLYWCSWQSNTLDDKNRKTEYNRILTEWEIENLFLFIDGTSVDIHTREVKNNRWKDCPLLIPALIGKPGANEYYGFCNFGTDSKKGLLHYESNGVHYYVVGLFKNKLIKNEGRKIINKKILSPLIKYYVVGSDNKYYWPYDTITSNVELENVVNSRKDMK